MTTRGKITHNFLFLGLSQGFSLLSSIALIAVLARSFTPWEFGMYGLLSSISSILVPLPFLGMTRVFERELSRCHDDTEASAKLFGATLLLRLISGLLLFWLIIAVTMAVPLFTPYLWAVIYAGAWVVLGPLVSAFTEYLVATERLEYEVRLNLVYKVSLVALVLLFVAFDGSFTEVLLAKALARTIQLVVMVAMTSTHFLVPSLTAPFSTYVMLVREGLPLEGSELLQMIFFKVDEILIGRLQGPAQVGLFHGPYQILLGLSLLPIQMMRSAFPSYSRIFVESRVAFDKAIQTGFMIVMGVSLPLMIALVMGSEEITLLLLGPQYEAASMALRLLSLTVPLLFIEVFFRFLLASMGKQHYDTIAMGVGVAVNVAVDIALIPFFGFLGACIGTITGQIAVVGVIVYYMRDSMELRPSLLGWWQVAVASLLMAVTLGVADGLGYWALLVPSFLIYGLVLLVTGVLPYEELGHALSHGKSGMLQLVKAGRELDETKQLDSRTISTRGSA